MINTEFYPNTFYRRLFKKACKKTVKKVFRKFFCFPAANCKNIAVNSSAKNKLIISNIFHQLCNKAQKSVSGFRTIHFFQNFKTWNITANYIIFIFRMFLNFRRSMLKKSFLRENPCKPVIFKQRQKPWSFAEPDDAFYTMHDNFRIIRLCNKINSSFAKTGNFIFYGITRSSYNYRNCNKAGILLHLMQEFMSIHDRHVYIQQNQGNVPVFFQNFQSFKTIFRLKTYIGIFKDSCQNSTINFIVINNQNFFSRKVFSRFIIRFCIISMHSINSIWLHYHCKSFLNLNRQ